MVVMIFLLLAAPSTQVHTEVQVEALAQPDRGAELSAELSRAQAELTEAKLVAASLPEGAQRSAEEHRLAELGRQITQLRALTAALPPGPEAKPPRRPEPPQALPVAPPRPASSSVWIALGFGLIMGVFVAFALVFRRLPGVAPKGAPRVAQLAIVAALLAALGPQLQSLGYDHMVIVGGWAILSIGAVGRMGERRVRSQLEAFALERAQRGGDDE
jgi:hypothetical protein